MIVQTNYVQMPNTKLDRLFPIHVEYIVVFVFFLIEKVVKFGFYAFIDSFTFNPARHVVGRGY